MGERFVINNAISLPSLAQALPFTLAGLAMAPSSLTLVLSTSLTLFSSIAFTVSVSWSPGRNMEEKKFEGEKKNKDVPLLPLQLLQGLTILLRDLAKVVTQVNVFAGCLTPYRTVPYRKESAKKS